MSAGEFSLSTLQLRPLRSLLRPGALLALAALLALEIAVRVLVPAGHVPSGAWHNVELRDQEQQLAEMGSVDLIFTGSSAAAVNFPPAAFDDELAQQGLRVTSFNGGIRGCNYSCIPAGLERMFLPHATPSVVAMVVVPSDMDDANGFVMNRSADFLDSFAVRPHEAAWVNALSRISWLYGFRAEIKEWLTTREWVYERSLIARQGHIDMGDEPRKRYEWDMRMDRNGPLARELTSAAQALVNKGIQVLILPAASESSIADMLEPADKAELAAVFEALDAMEGIQVVPLADLRPVDEHFIDLLHLNTQGAQNYVRAVARRLVEVDALRPLSQ